MTVSTRPKKPTTIAVAVVQHADQFLVGQRPEGVPLASYWEFPGGKVRPEESPPEAAVRECLEEAGLETSVVAAYPTILHDYPHGCLELHFFDCAPLSPQQLPNPPFRWVPRRELANLQFPPANANLLQILLAK